MDKAVGFRRKILLEWIDAAAASAVAGDTPAVLFEHLDPIVARSVASAENRRVVLGILSNIWLNNSQRHADLHATALRLYAEAGATTDRLWLHYGLAALTYPFFHQTVRAIGRQTTTRDSFTTADIKRAMIADLGHLGALDKAVERIVFSLRDWGLLVPGPAKNTLAPMAKLRASASAHEVWLLGVALTVHSGEELPFLDLIRQPEFFPFTFTLGLDQVRRHPWFAVQRQGAGLDMVRLEHAI